MSPGGPEDGYVNVKKLNDSDQDLSVVKVSLGVIGVISRIQHCLVSTAFNSLHEKFFYCEDPTKKK